MIKYLTSFIFLFFVIFAQTANCQKSDDASMVATAATSAFVVDGSMSSSADKNISEKKEKNPLFTTAHLKAQRDAEAAKHFAENLIEWVDTISPSTANLLKKSLFGLNIDGLVVAFSVFLLTWATQWFIILILFSYIERLLDKKNLHGLKNQVTLLRRPLSLFIWGMGINLILYLFIESASAISFVGRGFWIFSYVIFFWIITIFSELGFNALHKKYFKNAAAANMIELGRRVFKLAIGFVALIAILDLMGANVSAVVASLGIGGAALAFASKDTIANFFGSVSLVADRPFAVGDWIIAGGIEGVVEAIGIRSTRVRTFPKTIVTIPNSILANESINNMSKMPMRRAQFTIGLTYSTTPDQMIEVVSEIKKILLAHPRIDNNTFVVNFTEFGASSLDINIIYYCDGIDYANFSSIRQSVNVGIMKMVLDKGLSFAFPSQSIYVESMPNLK